MTTREIRELPEPTGPTPNGAILRPPRQLGGGIRRPDDRGQRRPLRLEGGTGGAPSPWGAVAPPAAPAPVPSPVPAPVNTDGVGGGQYAPPAPGTGWTPTQQNVGSRTDVQLAPTAPATGNATGYAQTSAYGPGRDLRGTQIAPGMSGATQAATGAAQQAYGAYQGTQVARPQGVAAGSYGASAEQGATRQMVMDALRTLSSGPSRGALAQQNMRLMNEVNAEQSRVDQRTIGQSAAKFGRIGAGITTTNLGDLGERQAISRDRAGRQLALDAAAGEIDDRFRTAGAMQGAASLFGGEDRANFGAEQAGRNEARSERDAMYGYDADAWSRRRTLFGDAAQYEDQQRGYDARDRAELRGERDYQVAMENQAYERGVRRTQLDDYLETSRVNRATQLGGFGYGGSPASGYERAADYHGQRAANGMAAGGELLGEYAYQTAQRRRRAQEGGR